MTPICTTGSDVPLRPCEPYTPSWGNRLLEPFDDQPMLRCYESADWDCRAPRVHSIVVTRRPAHPDCPTNGPEACAVCRVFYREVGRIKLRKERGL